MNSPDIKESKRHLRCELTDAELLQSGRELADRTADLVALENEKARITSDFNARIKGKEADVAILTSRVQSGYEYRDVVCREELDTPKPGKKRVFRWDTGKEIGVEDMTAAEMQRELEVDGGESTISCGGATAKLSDAVRVVDAMTNAAKKARGV